MHIRPLNCMSKDGIMGIPKSRPHDLSTIDVLCSFPHILFILMYYMAVRYSLFYYEFLVIVSQQNIKMVTADIDSCSSLVTQIPPGCPSDKHTITGLIYKNR